MEKDLDHAPAAVDRAADGKALADAIVLLVTIFASMSPLQRRKMAAFVAYSAGLIWITKKVVEGR